MSRMREKKCLGCGKDIPLDRNALFCSKNCSTMMFNKRAGIERNRVSACCDSELATYPDEQGRIVKRCRQCGKITNTAKIYMPAFKKDN